MSAQDFIEYYNKTFSSQAIFHFKSFIQEYCSNCVNRPVRLEIKSLLDCCQAKNLLIKNFCLNESFYSKDFYFTEDFCHLFYLLVNQKWPDESLAKIILLIMISKSDVDFYFFENYLQEINRLEFIDPNHFQNLIQLFDRFKKNDLIKKSILNISKEILNVNEINFSFEKLEIIFFKYPDHQLHGFAGVNRIYVAYWPLFALKRKLESKLNNDDTDFVLKIEFLRLFIHLCTHVTLMWTKNDLNFPHTKSHDFKSFWSLDSGIFAENKIFNFQINWYEFENVNLDLWRHFFNLLIEKEFFLKVNIQISGVKHKKKLKSINGVDYFSFH